VYLCKMLRIVQRTMSTVASVKRAGIIVIGDEILKGQVQDTNTHFLTKNLHQRGIRVSKVSVIPDDIDTIACEVKLFSDKYDFVLTSGGIGPTHDDLTFEAVAKAFDCPVSHHPKLVELCKSWFKKDNLDDPCFKLALVPRIPELLQRAFLNLGDRLFQADSTFCNKEVYCASDELSLTATLNKIVQTHPSVTFGSYPSWTNQYYKTKITLESQDQKFVDAAFSEIEEKMNPIHFDPSPAENAYDKIKEFIDKTDDNQFKEHLNKAIDVVEDCFKKYNQENVSVCFNGGKDCIVMLHLVHAVHQKLFPEKKLKSFYVSEKKTFDEVDDFIEKCIASYGLVNRTYQEPMKTALKQMLDDDKDVQATLLGVRKGDPGSKTISYFSPTDGDWPRVMRVHPILDWSYSQVWRFIRGLSLPYPSLYDEGYTSLGNPDNTRPNPALSFKTDSGDEKYHPAYMLEDASLERQGRS